MLETIALYAVYFFFYSAAGWLVESIYCSLAAKKWINRGFLTGPLCPIYGTGAVVMAVALQPVCEYPALVFFVGVILCDAVEFATSWIMEKLFHARWWDYSEKWLNIQGRICFRHSVYWGGASLLFIYFIHPNVGEKLFSDLEPRILYFILAAILVIFAIDLVNAVRKALDVKGMMDKIRNLNSALAKFYSELTENMVHSKEKAKVVTEERRTQLSEARENFAAFFRRGRKENRLLDNYPSLKVGSSTQLKKLDELVESIKHLLINSENEMF